MKKSILFLSFLLFAALFARGSDTKEVRLTFNGSDFSFAQENGAYSISAEKFPVIYDTDTLAPALPYYSPPRATVRNRLSGAADALYRKFR